jgi:phosphodiesterase/alkaline phosphatase D-like protein
MENIIVYDAYKINNKKLKHKHKNHRPNQRRAQNCVSIDNYKGIYKYWKKVTNVQTRRTNVLTFVSRLP